MARSPLGSSVLAPSIGVTSRSRPVSTTQQRTWRAWTTGAVALSVIVRLPMAWTPLSADEGGYLAIARGWADGATLYRGVWVDRPQGLVALFRLWDWLSGGRAHSVRVMAMLFGAVLVVATAIAVRAVAGAVAGGLAAVICATVTSAPVLEGYAANGELLAGAVAAGAIALAAVAAQGERPLRWWLAAGVLAGLALSLKQSGFDGVLVVGSWLAVAGLRAPTDRRRWALRLQAFAVGVLCPLLVLVVHAAITGWGRWWWAVVGYRLRIQSALSSPDWGNLARTAPVIVAVLGPVVVAAICGATVLVAGARRAPRRQAPGSAMLVLWPLVALMAIVLGGGFWRHYWVQLGAPSSALAGVALARWRRVAPLFVAVVLAPALVLSAWVFAAPPATWIVRAADDWRAPLNQQVADWFQDRGDRHPRLYVLCASAGLYAEAGAVPHYPYLWFVEVRHAPHAQDDLVRYLDDGRSGPEYVARYQSPGTCDSSGRVATILTRDFLTVTRIDGVTILERRPPRPAPDGTALRA